MRNVLLTLFTLLSFVFLILVNFYWEEKTDVSAYKTTNETASVEDAEDEEVTSSEEEKVDEEASTLISNWPEDAQAAFLQAGEENRPYKLAIVGSTALGTEEEGWAAELTSALKEAYGVALDVQTFAYDTTSIEFIHSTMSQEVLDYAPDLVLYEPFALNDNSRSVAVTDNHDSIEIFLSNLEAANENVVLLLQPTHPIYGATYYPAQVEKLQTFAEELGVEYLNHWEAWPSGDDEALKEYVTETQDAPNEKGHEVWAEYLVEYFINE